MSVIVGQMRLGLHRPRATKPKKSRVPSRAAPLPASAKAEASAKVEAPAKKPAGR